jgi:hypothetical protein
MYTHIFNAIDWLSVKLNVALIPIFLVETSIIMKGLALAATLSTLVYNGIRIYKELQKPKP